MKNFSALSLVYSTVLGFYTVYNPSDAQASDVVTVSTSVSSIDSYAPKFGDSLGIFKKHGIELKYIEASGGPAILAAVVGGSADVTHIGAAVYFPAIEKGAEIKLLMGNYDIDYTLIAQKGIGLDLAKPYPENIKSIKGRVVGVSSRGGATEIFVRKMLSDAGLNPETDVTYVAVGSSAAAAGAFINKQVEVMATLPPAPFIIGEENFDVVVDLDTTKKQVFGEGYLFTTFASSAQFVADRPEVAVNFCKAAIETIKAINDPANDQKLLDFAVNLSKLDPAKVTAMLKVYKSNFNPALDKARFEGMKKFTSFVPDWSATVFEPCATLSTQ